MASVRQISNERKAYLRQLYKLSTALETSQEKFKRKVISQAKRKGVPEATDFAKIMTDFNGMRKNFTDIENFLAKGYPYI